MKLLCARVKAECRKQKRSLRSVMKEAGLSVSTFYLWNASARVPKKQALTNLATALNVDVKTLVEGVEVSGRPSQRLRRPADLVFIGLPKDALALLMPFILRLAPNYFELPSDMTNALIKILSVDGTEKPVR